MIIGREEIGRRNEGEGRNELRTILHRSAASEVCILFKQNKAICLSRALLSRAVCPLLRLSRAGGSDGARGDAPISEQLTFWSVHEQAIAPPLAIRFPLHPLTARTERASPRGTATFIPKLSPTSQKNNFNTLSLNPPLLLPSFNVGFVLLEWIL